MLGSCCPASERIGESGTLSTGSWTWLSVRTGNAAENLSVLRRMALNMLKGETTSQGGVAAKRKRAGWDEDYLLTVLAL